jgi:energy-coupling factor transporter ATP-binding protein EcfA2
MAMPPGPEPHGAQRTPDAPLKRSTSHSSAVTDDTQLYPGARPYDERMAARFYGRGDATATLIKLMAQASNTPHSRLVAVVGPSGCGKTSLVRAGLVAAIRHGALPESASWPLAALRPTADPLAALAGALLDTSTGVYPQHALPALLQKLQADERTLHLFGLHLLANRPADHRLVVVVDQLEELFYHCRSEALRSALIHNLCYAAAAPGGRAVVVAVLRSEFYGYPGRYPRLAALLPAHQLLLGPLAPDSYPSMIEGPALAEGRSYEPGLADALARAAAHHPHGLLRLQALLAELWQQPETRTLTVSAYAAIGGDEGAWLRHAERTYEALSVVEQALCRRIFEHLVERHADGSLAACGAPLCELRRWSEDGDLEELVYQLVDARLLVLRPDLRQAAEVVVEIADPALVSSWPRLQAWAPPAPARSGWDWLPWPKVRRRLQGLFGSPRVAAASLAMVLGALALSQHSGEEAFRRGHARYLVAEGQVVFEERPLLGLRLVLEGLAAAPEIAGDSRTPLVAALRDLSAKGRVLKLGDDVEQVYPVGDNSAFVLRRTSAPDEVRWMSRAYSEVLERDVREVYVSLDKPFFVIAYDGGYNELRRIDTGQVLPLQGESIEQALFGLKLDTTFFAARHANRLSDLQEVSRQTQALARLSASDGEFIFDPRTQRLVAFFKSGDVYLIDVTWMRAVGDDPAARTESELVQIACGGPLASQLWTAQDELELGRVLDGHQPLACR